MNVVLRFYWVQRICSYNKYACVRSNKRQKLASQNPIFTAKVRKVHKFFDQKTGSYALNFPQRTKKSKIVCKTCRSGGDANQLLFFTWPFKGKKSNNPPPPDICYNFCQDCSKPRWRREPCNSTHKNDKANCSLHGRFLNIYTWRGVNISVLHRAACVWS